MNTYSRELIVDNFAGGGGASVGIELATGRYVDIAINHNVEAIQMHAMNHPYTRHYQEDVFAIDPIEVTGGQPVGIAWFSPDCRHFSRAKGNKPVDKKIRGLSWVILKWALSSVAPRCIFMENVEEIQTWGPLIEIDGVLSPDPEHSGETFKAFIGMLTNGVPSDCPALEEACEFLKIERDSKEAHRLINGLGYNVEFRVLKACDYGAPTIRKRFYLVARNDGKPIVFPEPTHGEGEGLKPYRTAAECIDWSIPCPSIFDRKKDLAPNTLRRIARGLDKFVVNCPEPFIIQMNYENQAQDVNRPLSTVVSVNHHFLVSPYMIPIGYGERKGQKPRLEDIHKPLGTVVSSNKHFVCMPFIMHYYGGAEHASSVDSPLATVTTLPRHYYVANYLCVLRKNMDGKSFTEPMPTLTTSAGHFANIKTSLLTIEDGVELYNWNSVRELLNTYCDYGIKDNEILVFDINGELCFIGDIGMRMLIPEELKLGQGFPVDYIIDIESYIGKKYSVAKQIARLGNAVCPPVATALIRANCPEMCCEETLITVADITKIAANMAV